MYSIYVFIYPQIDILFTITLYALIKKKPIVSFGNLQCPGFDKSISKKKYTTGDCADKIKKLAINTNRFNYPGHHFICNAYIIYIYDKLNRHAI